MKRVCCAETFRRASRVILCVGAINNERAAQTSPIKWCIETLLRQLFPHRERRSPLVILLALVKLSHIAPLRAMSADTRYPTCRSPAQSRRFYFARCAARWTSCERSSRWWIPGSPYMHSLRLIFLPLVAAEFLDLVTFRHLRNYSNHQLGRFKEKESSTASNDDTLFFKKICYQILEIQEEKIIYEHLTAHRFKIN